MGYRLLNLNEATRISRVSAITLRRAINAGELDGFKPGREILVKDCDLDEWIDSRKVVSSASPSTTSFSKTDVGRSIKPGSLREQALRQRGQL